MLSTTAAWSDLEPADVASLLAHVPAPWWVCGGWALDLFLGRRTRRHADFDVGCPRESMALVVDALEGWQVYVAHEGRLRPWVDRDPSFEGSIWLHREGRRSWDLQLMPEEVRDGTWRYRREPGIVEPSDWITWTTADGLLVLRPEVQLLYKSKDVRDKDQADFDATIGTLDVEARCWLRDRLRAIARGHPWIGRLETAGA